MLIRRLKVSGLLSFGPKGIDLPMESLNVLIGPNGSGKSNLLEVLGLLRAAPKNLAEPVRRRGGIWEWLWKGKESPGAGTVEVIVDSPDGERPLRHTLTVVDNGGRLQVIEEGVANAGVPESDADWYYRLSEGRHAITLRPRDTARIEVAHSEAKLEESVLSQIRDPHMYPALNVLQERYERIRLYQNWAFGPSSAPRRDQSAHGTSDFLNDGAENLAIVLSHFRGETKRRLVEALQELFDGIVDVSCPVTGGTVALFLVLHPAAPDPRIHETGYRVGAWRWPRGRFLYGAKSPFLSWTRSPASTPYCETGDVPVSAPCRFRTGGLHASAFAIRR